MKIKNLSITILALTSLLFASCGGDKGGIEEATALLNEIIQNPEDAPDLTNELRPTFDDYAEVFENAEFAKKAEASYNKLWDSGKMVLKGSPTQTELLIWAATGADLKAGNEKAQKFPGGYKGVAKYYKDDVIVYRFKFVEPGKTLGMAYDGLIFVNGHWRIFPKPWRMVR